jgi:CRP-like cAMP-binding protein
MILWKHDQGLASRLFSAGDRIEGMGFIESGAISISASFRPPTFGKSGKDK